METTSSSNTIDLSKALVQLIQTLNENFKTIVWITAASITLGLVYFLLFPRTYESKMIIQSNILSESYALRIADNINSHIHDKDFEYLGSKLNITTEEASQLKEFKITSALTPMSQQMAEEDKIIVVISVQIGDNAILPKLQKGIVEYLISNEYVKRRVTEREKEYESLIDGLEREIKMLDTLKFKISHGKFAATKVGDVMVMDVAALYGVTAALLEKKFKTQYNLAIANSIEVIEELSPYGKPIWPKLSIVLITSLLVAAATFSLVIAIRSSRKLKSSPIP